MQASTQDSFLIPPQDQNWKLAVSALGYRSSPAKNLQKPLIIFVMRKNFEMEALEEYTMGCTSCHSLQGLPGVYEFIPDGTVADHLCGGRAKAVSLPWPVHEEVKRMTTSVAELALLCLQQNKEMRPSMDEVLEQLKRIERGECKPENLNNDNVVQNMRRTVSSPDCQEASLLKNISLSPTSVTSKWVSSDIASSLSC
ncbi:hypothetical protein Patl1_15129 [Pistacia atlantica]|uniref:Uncharacterized protein n=1 Tax=Pistacia atlantica TaxID=434234 RepID=A0ACC1B7B8_9ROSI|nr:hypothetical protein Patl1_15129 [Pistacia atlantica]